MSRRYDALGKRPPDLNDWQDTVPGCPVCEKPGEQEGQVGNLLLLSCPDHGRYLVERADVPDLTPAKATGKPAVMVGYTDRRRKVRHLSEADNR